VLYLIRFIKKIFPVYFKEENFRFNSKILEILINIFEYMKNCDSQWAVCPGMIDKKKAITEWIKEN
jgi:hypothetical protein